MNCSFTEKISSLIDGELNPTETREVERHLLSCARVSTNTRRLSQPAQPDHQFRDVAATRSSEPRAEKDFGATRERSGSWIRNGVWVRRAVAFASLMIVAAIIGSLVYLNSNTRLTESISGSVSISSARNCFEPQKQPEPEAVAFA